MKKFEKVFWGLFFIAVGAYLILSQLGYMQDYDINILGLILTAFLVTIIIKSIVHLSFAGILFPLAFIGIIYDSQLGIEAVTPWTILLSALLGSIGLSMIFGKSVIKSKIHMNFNGDHEEDIIMVEDNNMRFNTTFGDSIKYINSPEFESASLKCSFGAMKAYFDNAQMKSNKATVQLNVSFGSMELFVPKGWRIEDKTSVSFGSLEFKNRNDELTTNTLVLVGSVSFGSVEIFYV